MVFALKNPRAIRQAEQVVLGALPEQPPVEHKQVNTFENDDGTKTITTTTTIVNADGSKTVTETSETIPAETA